MLKLKDGLASVKSSIMKSEIIENYKAKEKERKDKIKEEPNKLKRFFKGIGFLISFPGIGLFYNIRDIKTAIIFCIVLLVYSGSVGGFYLAALFCGGTATDVGKGLIGVGSTVGAWGLSPVGSPFILLCISTTIGVKALFNKIKSRR